jgi:hypothetical protein
MTVFLILALLFPFITAAQHQRVFSTSNAGVSEIKDVTDVYSSQSGIFYPINKFSVHENNLFHCNESNLKIRFFRINDTTHERVYFHGWLKPMGFDNRVVGEQEIAAHCKVIRR